MLHGHRSGLVPTLGRHSPLQTVTQGRSHASVFWLGAMYVKKHLEGAKNNNEPKHNLGKRSTYVSKDLFP